MAPRREHANAGADDMTMPGKRDRKTDGRFAVGDLIMGRYKVLAELGQGGMGVVYKCFDEDAGIEVALKALPPELSHNTLEMEDIKENFQLVHNLHHPNIASSNNLEKDKSNGNYYLIMECCEGEDLRRWLKRKRREGELKLEDILPIIQQVAEALDYAHKQKIIHRDIKPGNIMINAAGDIKVLDFGLAAQIHTSMTRVSMAYHGTSGTGPYMAPEQWRGRAQGASADQYALAVMTYEMLAGHLPFESTDAAVLQQAVLTQEAETIPDIAKTAQDAVKRAMSKEPGERFESCSDFAAALGGAKIKAASKQSKGGFPKWAAALIIAAILGVGGTGYYFFDQQQKEEARQEQLAREKAEKERLAKIAEEKRRADEKAEKERLAKLATEKRKKEAEAKAERDRLAKLSEEQLDSENAALKVELRDKIAEIKQKNYAPGQTFGQKINEMNMAFATAEAAKLLITANKHYKKAKQLADWLLLNGELRADAQKLKKQADGHRAEADRYEPLTYAGKLYTDAGEVYRSAVALYEKTQFKEAKKNFEASAKGFEKAKNTAFDNKLQFLTSEAKKAEKSAKWNELKVWAEKIRPLNQSLARQFINKADAAFKAIAVDKELAAARSAKAEKNWQGVYDYAVAALKIDSSSSAAQELKQEAEKNLKPTLEIIATVDGKRVPAEVKFGNQTMETFNKIFSGFTENSNYKGSLTYKKGEAGYVGEVEFTCDWRGAKKITTELTKVEFNGTVTLANGVKLEMVKIKAGTFTMGSPAGELGRDSEETQHKVTLTQDYWMGKFEVTQAQWQAVMGNNPSRFKGDNRPVEQVSWNDAKEFCNKLNEKYAGKLPAGYKFDLPTEAQWEYACRAGTTTPFSYGYASDLKKMNFDGNYPYGGGSKGVYREKTVDVKSLRYCNAWGVYNMHGNVREWCRDWSGSYTGDATDPVGPSSGSYRVARGGGWSDYAKWCRSAYRNGYSPGYRCNFIGFRLALVPVQ